MKGCFSYCRKPLFDTRYKDDFTITTNQLLTLTERVKTMQQVMGVDVA